jgi:hypothetical protein
MLLMLLPEIYMHKTDPCFAIVKTTNLIVLSPVRDDLLVVIIL